MTQSVFVTGATGFIGRHLVDVLLEKGFSVTAMVRTPETANLPDAVTVLKGDITSMTSLQQAMPDGVDGVFHVAADTSSFRKEADRQAAINVQGTANVIDVANDKRAGRFIHVSSVVVFGLQKREITETTPMAGLRSWVSYVRTKSQAERLVRQAGERGLDTVIVNPTHVVGHYDTANWARLIKRSASGELPGIPPGCGNFANGRAVAEAMVTAFEKAPSGANYLLGGPVASFEEFIREAAGQTGASVKVKVLPAFVLKLLSTLGHWGYLLTGKRPNLTPEEAYFACEDIVASSARAEEELGYRIVPLKDSIAESVAYLREVGELPSA